LGISDDCATEGTEKLCHVPIDSGLLAELADHFRKDPPVTLSDARELIMECIMFTINKDPKIMSQNELEAFRRCHGIPEHYPKEPERDKK